MQQRTPSFIFWIYLLGISGMLALLLTSSARASVANLEPNTTPGYVAMFDSKLALTNAPVKTNGMSIDFTSNSVPMLRITPFSGNTTIQNPANKVIYFNQIGGQTLFNSQNDTFTIGNNGAIGLSSLLTAGNPFSGRRFDLHMFLDSTASVQQNSQSLNWLTTGWSTNLGTAQGVWFSAYVQPYSGAALPIGTWVLGSQIQPGGFVTNLVVSSSSGYAGGGTKYLSDDGTYKTVVGGTFNPTSLFVPYNNAGSWADSIIYKYVTADGFMVFTNATQTTAALFGSAGNSAVIRGATAVQLLDGLVSGNEVMWTANHLASVQTNAVLGSGGLVVPRNEWGEIHSWSNIVHGYYDSTGTNYVNRVDHFVGADTVFDLKSVTNNLSGPVGKFLFKTNDVAVFTIPGGAIWDDSMVPEALVRVGASAPSQANFNGGPGQTLQFQNNRDDAILASVQLSHRYKQGTDVYPHVHWAETATTGAGTNIVWELQYTWANPDAGVFPAYATNLMTNSITGTNWWHSMKGFPAVSGTGRAVSAIMVFQLRRLANSATADDYNQNIAFLGFDLHYQVDSPGSDSATVKSF